MKSYFKAAVLYVLFISGFSVVHAENVRVKLSTTAGDIHIELFEDHAPVTVANFLKYADQNFMDIGAFYRAVRADNQPNNDIKVEAVQGGVGPEDGRKVFYDPIPLERTDQTGIMHLDGTLSMARDGVDTGSSEFFICIGDQPELDFGGKRHPDGQGFAAFGQVTSGMDIIREIQNMATDLSNTGGSQAGQILNEPVKFISISRE